ncbi:MAG: polymer-forming cytoskeletal protein [Deltaproteobacteria bacterium]|nr:polymer-forming cytoskeletal protein [Deltaproteobacteria bacterium]
MFNKKDEHMEAEINGFVGNGMTVEGKLIFEGSVRIDGKVKGEISSTGTLLIGEGAIIEAEINVDTAIISGEVQGIVNAKGRVELHAPARVIGDIRTPTLIIGEGVIFEGNCLMVKKGADLKPVEETA